MNKIQIKFIKENNNYKHGYACHSNEHPLYAVWLNMKQRCLNKNNPRYCDYGGRGITICEDWLNPKNFIEWCLNNGWEQGLQIDRIENDKGYTSNNCRFTTSLENNKNQRLLTKKNTSGYRGVSWHKKNNMYQARVSNKGKLIHIGSFLNQIDAAKARDKYVIDNNLGLPLNSEKQNEILNRISQKYV